MDAKQGGAGSVVRKFIHGDIVIIRHFHEIYAMLTESDDYDNLYFNPEMKVYCGHRIVLDSKKRNRVWSADNEWFWHEHWFTYSPKEFFTSIDFEI